MSKIFILLFVFVGLATSIVIPLSGYWKYQGQPGDTKQVYYDVIMPLKLVKRIVQSSGIQLSITVTYNCGSFVPHTADIDSYQAPFSLYYSCGALCNDTQLLALSKATKVYKFVDGAFTWLEFVNSTGSLVYMWAPANQADLPYAPLKWSYDLADNVLKQLYGYLWLNQTLINGQILK